jgi:hypothetical protein
MLGSLQLLYYSDRFSFREALPTSRIRIRFKNGCHSQSWRAFRRYPIGYFFLLPIFTARPQSSENSQGCSIDSLRRGYANERDPIVRYLTERHAPVHEGLVTSPNVWKIICPRPDRWHVMAGLIVVRSREQCLLIIRNS